MSIKNVSFIGLGVMGFPMAGHLQNNGYNVTVYNRTTTKAEKWVEEYKGSIAKTPVEASKNSEIVFMCVGRDEDIIEVMEGEGGILSNVVEGIITKLSNVPPGTIPIPCFFNSPIISKVTLFNLIFFPIVSLP